MTRYSSIFTMAAFGIGLGLLLLVVPPAKASEVYVSEDNALAIEGTDPVAYFIQSRPVEGSSAYTASWKGAIWHFSSAENRDRFQGNPEQFAPQYGGYCAWAVSRGYTAEIDPEAWSIVDGKLYLNYSKSVQKDWEEDIPGNIKTADMNWPDIRADLAK